MDRRGTSVLLIPLLAAFALFYPAAAPRPMPSPSAQVSHGSRKQPVRTKKQPPESELHAGPEMVLDFFGSLPRHELPKGKVPVSASKPRLNRLHNLQIDFLLATVPDPVDSGLPHEFDRLLGSMQAAIQRSGYSLVRFYLPWQDCLLGRGQDANDNKERDESQDEQRACLLSIT